jgi:hypothetical protein
MQCLTNQLNSSKGLIPIQTKFLSPDRMSKGVYTLRLRSGHKVAWSSCQTVYEEQAHSTRVCVRTSVQGPTKMEELITVSCLECGNTASPITLVGNTDQYSTSRTKMNIGRYFLQG